MGIWGLGGETIESVIFGKNKPKMLKSIVSNPTEMTFLMNFEEKWQVFIDFHDFQKIS